MADIGVVYGGAGGAVADQRSSMLLYPPQTGPSQYSQYKDFHGDIGHYPGRGAPGQSAGWQATDSELAADSMTRSMDYMRGHMNTDQSYRAVSNEERSAPQSKQRSSGAAPTEQQRLTYLIIIAVLALLVLNGFFEVSKRKGGA